ncbi:Sugar transport protein 8 [Linum perenne]
MFYAPVLFQTAGFKNDGALLSAVISGIVNVFSTLVSVFAVDKVGRKVLLLQACCQIVFVMAFAWSWGPLGWLIQSETFPVETRAVGFAFAVSSNMLFTFIIAQAFLSMMCHMKAYIFFFFAAWIVVIGLFVIFLLPETKGVPIDAMVDRVWKKHPVWRKFMD